MNALIFKTVVLSTTLCLSACALDTSDYASPYPNYNVDYTYPTYNWGTDTYWGYRYGDRVYSNENYDDRALRGPGGNWYFQ